MKHTMTAAAKAEATATDFFALSDIEVPIRYDFAPDTPMRFFMRLQMNKEALEANQKFLGLTPAEREAKEHNNNVFMIATLSTRMPEGVPGLEQQDGESPRKAIERFFIEESEMKRKVCVDVLNRYFRLIQPKEYL